MVRHLQVSFLRFLVPIILLAYPLSPGSSDTSCTAWCMKRTWPSNIALEAQTAEIERSVLPVHTDSLGSIYIGHLGENFWLHPVDYWFMICSSKMFVLFNKVFKALWWQLSKTYFKHRHKMDLADLSMAEFLLPKPNKHQNMTPNHHCFFFNYPTAPLQKRKNWTYQPFQEKPKNYPITNLFNYCTR